MKIKPSRKMGSVVMELTHDDDHLMETSIAAGQKAPFKLREIMVPVDVSEPSEKALEYAIPFAKKFGANITLLHVIEPLLCLDNAVVPPETEEVSHGSLKLTRKQLEALRARKINSDITSKSLVLAGVPHQQINELARLFKTDLIIIATRGHSGLKRFFLGSTAEKVVRNAPCPVLIVREDERDFVWLIESSSPQTINEPSSSDVAAQFFRREAFQPPPFGQFSARMNFLCATCTVP